MTLRKFRVLWLRLDCLNLNSDLVQSIAQRKATEMCENALKTLSSYNCLCDMKAVNLHTAKERTMSANKGMSEEPKELYRIFSTDSRIA